jgi:hypothetical protein
VSTNIMPSANAARGLGTGTWHLDPPRSSVEFHVRLFYGLLTVKGRFERYQGSLDLAGSHPKGGFMESMLLDAAGHRRSPATMPGYHPGRPPRNKGEEYPADPPTVEGDRRRHARGR